ncbi:MAG: hydantoinase/oxoprolinase family protein [Actinomycetota bacterium]
MRIGIDTGGTYTDAVRYHETAGVLATAKARTRIDLSVGIAEALDAVLDDPTEISLVCLSTTLATNALVEGVGGRVALVSIGFTEAELERGGLRDALGDAPVIMAAGGHDSVGNEQAPLELDRIVADAADQDVAAFAVAGQFSVRNPAHELQVKEALSSLGKPVACSHELSAKLNGPKRALTCLLNARLIGLIAELSDAAEKILADRNIDAPLMIVRGDGSLVSAAFARNRPIETILSGPAASLIGAGHLAGQQEVVVSDIGGTTTDVGVLRGGMPKVSTDGATVGGHRTMVEAVEMFTYGLGGDSEIQFDQKAKLAGLLIGPRRVTPLSLLATEEPDLVHRTLDRREFPFRDRDVMFAAATGRTGPVHDREQRVLDKIGDRWVALDEVANSSLEMSALRTLVSRSLVRLAGFTPSDAAHVLGLHNQWDDTAAVKAAELMAAAADSGGNPVRENGREFAEWVMHSLTRRSTEAVLEAVLGIDGFPADAVRSELVQRAIDGHRGATSVRVGPTMPIVGLGASVATYYPGVAAMLGVDGIVPEHAEVANAVGAAVGRVRIVRQATVSQPTKGQFRIHVPGAGDDLGNLEPAIDRAVALLSEEVTGLADDAGAASVTLDVDVQKKTAEVGGKTVFVEGVVTVVGSGPPKLG